jgi:HK97 family phage portal protein
MTDEDLNALSVYWEMRNLASLPPDPRNQVMANWFAPNNAGVTVTPDTALQVSTIWACVNAVSGPIASSDWNVYQRLPKGDHEAQPDDPAQWYLNVRPNLEMTAKSMKQALMIAACFWGNGYAEILRDMAGRFAGLWPIMPDRVDMIRERGEIFYKVKNDDGSEVLLSSMEMFHVRGPGLSGLLGDNIVTRGAHSIALSIAAERFAESYFGNNTQMGVLIEMEGSGAMSQEAYDRLKESFQKRHKGPNNAFRFGVLEGGAKLHQLNVQASEAQLTESRLHQVEEICRWFGVPPHMVAHLKNATLNNVEHLGIQFTRNTLRPWAREIQEEAEYKLFPVRGKPRFIMLDLEWASQGDYKTRMEGHSIGRGMGVLSANDILKKEGMNTIGKEGDIRIVNGAAVRLEDVGKNVVAAPTSTSTQPDRGEGSQPDKPDTSARVLERWTASTLDRVRRRYENRLLQTTGNVAKASTDAIEYLNAEVELIFEEARKINPDFDEFAAKACLSKVVLNSPPLALATEFINRFVEKQ